MRGMGCSLSLSSFSGKHLQTAHFPPCNVPVTMAGRPEAAVKVALAAGVVTRMSWLMR